MEGFSPGEVSNTVLLIPLWCYRYRPEWYRACGSSPIACAGYPTPQRECALRLDFKIVPERRAAIGIGRPPAAGITITYHLPMELKISALRTKKIASTMSSR